MRDNTNYSVEELKDFINNDEDFKFLVDLELQDHIYISDDREYTSLDANIEEYQDENESYLLLTIEEDSDKEGKYHYIVWSKECGIRYWDLKTALIAVTKRLRNYI